MEEAYDATESYIEELPDCIHKIYTETYEKWNKEFNRNDEGDFLESYKSEFFVKIITRTKEGIILEKLDIPLGTRTNMFQDSLNAIYQYTTYERLIRWLDELKKELDKLGIQHRDIHPGNIMYSIPQRKFKLIDFSWAKTTKQDLGAPEELNGKYGADEEAIEKIKQELKQWESQKKNLQKISSILL